MQRHKAVPDYLNNLYIKYETLVEKELIVLKLKQFYRVESAVFSQIANE